MTNKGFTLVELLIVIAILGVLSSAVVLVLNPAELLKQARDSTRASDMATFNSALSLYLTDTTDPDLNSGGTVNDGQCAAGAGGRYYVYGTVAPTNNSFAQRGTAVPVASQAVNGAGWLPVNFSAISAGAPLGNLPIDPTNTGDLVYRYACDMTAFTYEVNSQFESKKYKDNLDLDEKDGGNQPTFYEIGNDPGLDL